MSAFDDLRQPDRPVEPDRRFARRLRADLEAALAPTIDLPDRSTTMTTSETTPAATGDTTPAGGGLHPYITAHDAAAAMDWYVTVFDAVETTRYVGDDGRIGHGELTIGAGRLLISDEYPDFGALSPRTVGGTPVKLHTEVPDVDAVWRRALDGGADGHRPPEDQPYGSRACAFADPFGHQWMVQTVVATPSAEEIEADMDGFTVVVAEQPDAPPVELAYVTLAFDDTDRARRFYGELFGWETIDGASGPGYAHVDNTRLPLGMAPGSSTDAPSVYFGVDDLDRAAAQVVALGGRVVDRPEYARGAAVVCQDDQGRTFTLISNRYG